MQKLVFSVVDGKPVWLCRPLEGFGVNVSLSEIKELSSVKVIEDRPMPEGYFIHIHVGYGSHMDWEEFRAFEPTRELAIQKIEEDFNHWIDNSEYAQPVRDQLGIPISKYAVLPYDESEEVRERGKK